MGCICVEFLEWFVEVCAGDSEPKVHERLFPYGTALNGNIITNIPTTARRYSPMIIFGGF